MEINKNINKNGLDVDVSYCVPSFNHSNYIMRTLESIEKDILISGLNSEIVILDDGSLDSTDVIIKQFIEKTSVAIRYFRFSNAGISGNLNRIKKHANGRWVRLCASDDIILPGSTKFMFSSTRDELNCIVSDGYVIDEDDEKIGDSLVSFHGGIKEKMNNSSSLLKEVILNYSFAGPCLLINKRFYDKYQYDVDSKIDDYDFFVSMLVINEKSLIFIDSLVCGYRIHSANTSKVVDLDKRIMNQQSMLLLVNKFLKYKKFTFLFVKKKIEVLLKIIYLKVLKVFSNV